MLSCSDETGCGEEDATPSAGSQMCSQISEELNISAERISPDTIIVVIIVQHQQSIELNGGQPMQS